LYLEINHSTTPKMSNMATITLKYNARNVTAKKFIDLALSLGVFKVEGKNLTEIQKSLQEAQNGEYFTAKDGKDAIAKCLE